MSGGALPTHLSASHVSPPGTWSATAVLCLLWGRSSQSWPSWST